MYRSEALMSKDFESYLRENFGKTYFKEFKGLFGIPDYVCFSKDNNNISIVSFELKLANWKCAIIHAFRYRSFSDRTYVVLPEKTVHNALENINMFRQYNIGLVSFTDSQFTILYRPMTQKPYNEDMRRKVVQKVRASRKKAIRTIDSIL